MRICTKPLMISSVIFAACFCGANICRAAVSFTVTPSVVSNTYAGVITLNITGLTNGEQVKVQTYLDLNSNGVVDPGEPLIDAFNLTDGGASIIGGITNISVPFDSNSATGAITASLSFAPTLENIVGQRIYRVISNPSGAFTPVTATFAVTNAALGQSVSGTVYSNGITPLPYAVVVALGEPDQNYAGSAIADSSGHYFLTLNPGTYAVMPAFPGFYADQSLLPVVTLTNGVSATNDLSVTNGTVAISGQVYDASSSSALGGVFMQIQSGSLFEVAFTDTNGNYTAEVASNNWKIQIDPERLSRRGYVTLQGNSLTVNATLGDVANADIGLYKGNALFYGQLTINNLPVPNMTIVCNDQNAILHGKSYTDANGDYADVALEDTNVLGTNDSAWYCSPNVKDSITADAYADYIFDQAENIVLTNGQASLQNLIGLPITATISGHLLNNQGIPVSSVSVGGSATIDGNQFVTSFPDTDTNGYYSFGAINGQWYVNANNNGGSDTLEDQGYYDPASNHVVTIPPANPVVNITVYPIGTPLLSQIEHISSTEFGFNLTGSEGFNYTVQASTNLTSNWFTLTTISNFPGDSMFIEDSNATNSQRFYRVLEEP